VCRSRAVDLDLALDLTASTPRQQPRRPATAASRASATLIGDTTRTRLDRRDERSHDGDGGAEHAGVERGEVEVERDDAARLRRLVR